jgi:hypothetical protein
MDQKELLRKGEGGKPDTFLIVLVMHLIESDNLVEESKIFKSVVLDWYQARGTTAEKVQLIACSDPKYHAAIKELFESLHGMELSLRPVFAKIPFGIALHDSRGTPNSNHEYHPDQKPDVGGFERRLQKLKDG